MLFSHIILVAVSVFGFVQAIPSPTAKAGVVARDTNAEVAGVLNTLKGRTDDILPQIDAFVADGSATDQNVKPLFDQLSAALTTAQSSLQSQGPSADIVKNINTTLTSFPFHFTLINAITLLLFNLIISLNFLLPGVIAIVVGLLNGVVGVVLTLLLALITVL